MAANRRRLSESLHSVAIHVLRHAREADRDGGLGPARLSALSVLVFGGSCTLGELAESEQVTAPTMTRVVQGLERSGLAERKPCANDARSFVIRATRKGEQVLAKARDARLRRIDGLLKDVPNADLELLERALARVFPQ